MFEIKFSTDNVAFEDPFDKENDVYMVDEVRRILEEVCEKLEFGHTEGKCIDINGNIVGEWRLS